jgi:hypothetical protein
MKNKKKNWLADLAKDLTLHNQKDLRKESILIPLLCSPSLAKCLEAN